ncbi:MAG: hypothetical protein M3O70_17795 [Actinomycetota bacterium]|nr:hypothetical protein [Actinomycetota bacterium]
MSEGTYIVAVRRDQRDTAPHNWLDRLRTTEGVSVIGGSSARAQIEVDPGALERVLRDFGAYLHVEPVIQHFPRHGQTG